MDYQKFTLAKGPSYPSVIGSVIDPIGAVGLDAIDKILGNTEAIHSRSQSRDATPAAKHKPDYVKQKLANPQNEQETKPRSKTIE
jgi:hypothetical protein